MTSLFSPRAMFLRPQPVVQALYLSKPSKPPHFVLSRYTSNSSVSFSALPHQLRRYYNPLGRRSCTGFFGVSVASSRSGGRKAGCKFSRKKLEVRLERHCNFRFGKGAKCSRERKGLFEDLGEVECRATLKEGESSATTQRNSNNNFPQAGTDMGEKSLWSKFTQSVNVSGIVFATREIVKDRHLAIPHVSVPDVFWIDWKALRARGFEGVLFDKDNTLTAPYGQNVWPPLNDSLKECREVFEGRIALLSNSAGLYQYDPLGAEAKAVEKRLGIPVIRHGKKKPAGNALAVSNYFGCDPSLLIMVGDRYFTDVVFGNSNGLLTIRPAPLTTLGEPFIVRQVRRVEEALVDKWRQCGFSPTTHKLFHNPVDFIKDPGCW